MLGFNTKRPFCKRGNKLQDAMFVQETCLRKGATIVCAAQHKTFRVAQTAIVMRIDLEGSNAKQ